MAITPVQSVKGYTANSGTVAVNITPTAGNCLILSVGMYSSNSFWNILRQQNLPFTNFVTDNQSNEWQFVGISPSQFSSGGGTLHSAVATFIAFGVVGVATAVSVQTVAQYVEVMIDEVAGAATYGVDDINFNSTAYGSGLSSIASGNIAITGTEFVYSVGFADTASETLTASAGFTQLQTDTNTGLTMSTFYKNFTGGTASNTITANSTPGSLHVLVFALSSTVVPSIVLQNAYMIDGGPVTTSAAVPFSNPNVAGNLLVLKAYLYERGTAVITDTQGNNWVIPITPPTGSTNIVMAYCLSAKTGMNTVTLATNSGGNNGILSMRVTEYNIQGAVFNVSSVGNNTTPGNTVNTGNITCTGKSLLVSMMASDAGSGSWVAVTKVGSSPGTWRSQASDGFQTMIADADQIVTTPGAYSNTFTTSSSANDLYSGILGFNLPSSGGGGTGTGVGNMSPCGQLPSPELTVDINADWGDEDTFFITQDTPYPFTLRGIVLRMSVNQD